MSIKNIVGTCLLLVGLAFSTGNIIEYVMGSYQYENTISAPWSLADKASTIPQKAHYIDLFVTALESSGLKGEYNALFLKTPNNSFDANLEALKSLQSRLHEIEKMDITSFQYQTAIQQITAQEQGEAKAMLSVFEGVWWKRQHFWLWDWICTIQVLLFITFIVSGLVCYGVGNDFLP